MERENDTQIDAASAVMQSLYQTIVVKKELKLKSKLLIYLPVHIPTLNFGPKIWVMKG